MSGAPQTKEQCANLDGYRVCCRSLGSGKLTMIFLTGAIFRSFWNPEQFIEIFKKSLSRFQYEVLTGVGHYPMLEKPDQVNATLTRIATSLQET